MVTDAPLQIRHRGSVVACPDLVSGHCCLVRGKAKLYLNCTYNTCVTSPRQPALTQPPSRLPYFLRYKVIYNVLLQLFNRYILPSTISIPLLITILLFKPQLFNHYTSINHRTHLHPSTISPPISAHILSPLISPLPPHSYPPSQPYFCPIIRTPR